MSSTYSKNLELAVLSKVLNNGSDFPLLDGMITSESFVWFPNRIVWDTFRYLYDTGSEINPFTLETYLDRVGKLESITGQGGIGRGVEYINAISSFEESETTPLETVAKELQKTSALRHIVDLSDKIKGDAMSGVEPDKILGYIETEAGTISSSAGGNVATIQEGNLVAKSVHERIKDGKLGKSPYIETGLRAWDNHVGGLRGGRIYIPCGNSGDGKSTLALYLLYKLSMENPNNSITTGIISFELENEETGFRLLQMDTGFDTIQMEKGIIPDAEKYKKAIGKLKNCKIYFDDSPTLTLSQTGAKIQKLVNNGCRVIVVDQLAQMTLNNFSGGANYGDNDIKVYYLKSLARKYDIAIVSPHQLKKSASAVDRKTPWNVSLSDVSESGERGADGVVFLRHNDDGENRLIWTKTRQGTPGWSRVGFDMERRIFHNIQNDDLRPNELDFLEGSEDE